MSIERCGASCAASSTTRAPCRRATAASSPIGHSSPVTFDAPVSTTRRGPLGALARAVSSRPTVSPADSGVCSRMIPELRQGSMAAWCSVSNMTTVADSGSEWASRFSASVVLRVNTTTSVAGAPTNARSTRLADSYTRLETWEAKPVPRWTLAYQGSSSLTASWTTHRQGALAAWSRFAYRISPPVASGTSRSAPTTGGIARDVRGGWVIEVRSMSEEPAVRTEHLAVDPPALGAGEERDDICDILRTAYPTQGNPLGQLLDLLVRPVAQEQLRGRRTWGDRVGGDVAAGEFAGKFAGQRLDRDLAGVVERLPGHAERRRGTGERDDAATRAHPGGGQAQDVKGAPQVDVDDAGKAFVVGAGQRAPVRRVCPRADHDGIDAAIGLLGRVERRGDIPRVREVAADRDSPRPGLVDSAGHFSRGRRVVRETDDHIVAGRGQLVGDPCADTSRAAEDDGRHRRSPSRISVSTARLRSAQRPPSAPSAPSKRCSYDSRNPMRSGTGSAGRFRNGRSEPTIWRIASSGIGLRSGRKPGLCRPPCSLAGWNLPIMRPEATNSAFSRRCDSSTMPGASSSLTSGKMMMIAFSSDSGPEAGSIARKTCRNWAIAASTSSSVRPAVRTTTKAMRLRPIA